MQQQIETAEEDYDRPEAQHTELMKCQVEAWEEEWRQLINEQKALVQSIISTGIPQQDRDLLAHYCDHSYYINKPSRINPNIPKVMVRQVEASKKIQATLMDTRDYFEARMWIGSYDDVTSIEILETE